MFCLRNDKSIVKKAVSSFSVDVSSSFISLITEHLWTLGQYSGKRAIFKSPWTLEMSNLKV